MDNQAKNKSILLAEQYFKNDELDLAEHLLKNITNYEPQNSRANELLAYISGNKGDSELSHKQLVAACQSKNCTPAALYYLGLSHFNRNSDMEAIHCFEESLKKVHPYFEVLHYLGCAHARQGNQIEAIDYFVKAIELNTNSHETYYNLAKILDDQKRYDEALRYYDMAIELNADFAEAFANSASILSELKNYQLAITRYEKAIELKPNMAFVLGDYLHAKMKISNWDGLNENILKCIEGIKLSRATIEPLVLLSLVDDPKLQQECATIFAKEKFLFKGIDHLFLPQKTKKIKIAYLSPDLRNHPVSYLISEVLKSHNHEKFETYGIYFGPKTNDEMHHTISSSFTHFLNLQELSDLEITQKIRQLDIDIVVDLAGYTQNSRTQILSARCAPIQINFLGYPGTMGEKFIDYIIADELVIPNDQKNFYSEKIVYMPSCFQANSPRPILRKINTKAELGLPSDHFIFCCFNNSNKITPYIFDIWSEILNAVKDSILWIATDNDFTKSNLLKEACKRGIDDSRIIFCDRVQYDEYLARYQLADLFLDTLPFNAGTTASDALWAGLPVLTRIGQSFSSRMAASLLNTLAIPELITHSEKEYIEKAIELASHPEKLHLLQKKLDENKNNSSLFDSNLFCKNLEVAYETMYNRYIAGLSPDSIDLT